MLMFIVMICAIIFMVTPYGWKMQGMTFVNGIKDGHELVYQGKVIATVPSTCIIEFSTQTEQFKTICDDVEKIYINGKEVGY
jgi:hypothetical protein